MCITDKGFFFFGQGGMLSSDIVLTSVLAGRLRMDVGFKSKRQMENKAPTKWMMVFFYRSMLLFAEDPIKHFLSLFSNMFNILYPAQVKLQNYVHVWNLWRSDVNEG